MMQRESIQKDTPQEEKTEEKMETKIQVSRPKIKDYQ